MQYLQKVRGLPWMYAARELALLAGVDPSVLDAWQSRWTAEDFKRHKRLEERSSLLGMFMAYTHSVFVSSAGKTVRDYLAERRGFPEARLKELDLGLYPALEDAWHYLKKTSSDLEELRARGLFEPSWTGCILASWKDLQGRTVNIWGWQPWEVPTKQDPLKGYFLFGEDDPLGGRRQPFYLDVAARLDKRDLVLVEGPITALLAHCLGLQNPFPVAAGGNLNKAQVETFKSYLGHGGSLTLCWDYDPEVYGTGKDKAFRTRNLLKKVDFPVYVVDASLLAENGKAKTKVGVDEFILTKGGGEKGLYAFQRLLETRQAEATVQRSAPPEKSWPDLLGVFRADPAKQLKGDILELLFGAAEEIGQRIAKGFLKALPQGFANTLLPGPTNQLEGLSQEKLELPAEIQSPPPSFHPGRLEEEGRRTPSEKSSAWQAVDSLEVRFQPGDLAVIAGRHGHGKTSMLIGLLVDWLTKASQQQTEELFLVYSIEESEVRIYHRLLSLLTAKQGRGWTLNEIQDYLRDPFQDRPGWGLSAREALQDARQCFRDWEAGLRIVYRPTWKITEIEDHARRLAEERRLGAILVDHFQRIPPPPPKRGRRSAQGSAVARSLKALAVELSCPVVATAQIGRQTIRWAKKVPQDRPFEDEAVQEAIGMRRPQLHQLKESGCDEEADLVLGLLNYLVDYRTELGRRAPISEAARLEVGTLKNRSGPVGCWSALVFDGRFGFVRDPPPIQSSDSQSDMLES